MKVILPTRGLIYASTLKSLKDSEIEFKDLIIIEGLPIPACFNTGVKEALKEVDSHILFMEEDMVLPDGALDKMVKMDKPVVCIDYALDNGYSTILRKNNEIWWCGLGCTLIKQSVFKYIPEPWFDTSYSQRIISHEPYEIEKVDNPAKYGGQDINFFIKVRKAGFRIHQLPGFEAKHLRCSALKRGNYNQGVFEIEELSPISKQQNYA